MKIQVRREDNLIEVLTLTEPLTITRCSCGHNYITTSTGMEHHFTSEGIYDGFGFLLPIGKEVTLEEAEKFADTNAKDYLLQYDSEREVLKIFSGYAEGADVDPDDEEGS